MELVALAARLSHDEQRPRGEIVQRDRLLAARPNPMCFGIGDRALVRLSDRAPDLAEELAPWWSEVVERAETQCVAVDDGTAEVGTVAAASPMVRLSSCRC